MGAEVSRHGGSATLQAPQPLGNGEGTGSALPSEQVAGMACLGSWLSTVLVLLGTLVNP